MTSAAQNPSQSVTAVAPFPVGSIIAYGAEQPPNGWLICDGQSITQADYPNRFAVIGGTGPDLRSRFVIGVGQGAGLSSRPLFQRGGEEKHVLSVAEMPEHNHTQGIGGGYTTGGVGTGNSEGYATDRPKFQALVSSAGGSQAHNNMPPFFALTYIIKY
ncbi:MAG: tail fiber protein [Bacteroidota bacterium]